MVGEKPFELSGLYFPWATLDQSTLKKALLYFDSISLFSPAPVGSDISGGMEDIIALALSHPDPVERIALLEKAKRIRQFQEEVRLLVDAGVMHLLTQNDLPTGVNGAGAGSIRSELYSDSTDLRSNLLGSMTKDELVTNEATPPCQ